MAWYVYAGFLAASYVYHRWIAESPPRPKPASEIEIPKIDEGSSVPLIYGRCRVRAPVIAWASEASAVEVDPLVYPSPFEYRMDLMMVLGIPFKNPLVRLWAMWSGDMKMTNLGWGGNNETSGIAPWNGVTIANTASPTESGRFVTPRPRETGQLGGFVQLYDGRGTQTHTIAVDPFTGISHAGVAQRADGVPGPEIPGFRGVVSVCHFGDQSLAAAPLWGLGGSPDTAKWQLGGSPNLGAYSYEVSSYPADSGALNVGLEANPAKVILDILLGDFGKLGLLNTQVDLDSFNAAAIRLQEEGNGYSRAIDVATEAVEIIREILEQIDGVLFEDARTGKLTLKLIRDDYDVSALIGVTVENCERLENFAAGGWENIVNKVRVVFSDRARHYQEGSATAHNQALADGPREYITRLPGVCTQALANELAARELAARSRPIAKCRAIVDRTFARVNPGDPIRVTWPEYGIDGRVFRVARVNRGTLENGKIALDLIEDFFYVWRNVLIPGHPIEGFPGGGGGGVLEDP